MLNKTIIKKAFQDSIPVMTGYVFLGAGFGILMRAKGSAWYWPLLLSGTVYAGAMQYVAVDLLSNGVSVLTAAVTALMVNARHLFYGFSLIDRYRDAGSVKPYLIFGLTDETYALVSRNRLLDDQNDVSYCFWVTFLDHFYWLTGTLLGTAAGSILHFNWEGIDFALTALFTTIVVEQWKTRSDHFSACIGFCVSLISLICFGPDRFLIPSMAGIFLVLSWKIHSEKKKEGS